MGPLSRVSLRKFSIFLAGEDPKTINIYGPATALSTVFSRGKISKNNYNKVVTCPSLLQLLLSSGKILVLTLRFFFTLRRFFVLPKCNNLSPTCFEKDFYLQF